MGTEAGGKRREEEVDPLRRKIFKPRPEERFISEVDVVHPWSFAITAAGGQEFLHRLSMPLGKVLLDCSFLLLAPSHELKHA